MSGFEGPNYTQAPNAFFDKVLSDVSSMSELKVTLAVIRHTMGFHRQQHELSLSYLVEYTGMRKATVIDGLKRGLKRGTITRHKSGDTYAYSLKIVGGTESVPAGGIEGVRNSYPRKKGTTSETNVSSVAAEAAPYEEMTKGQRQAYFIGYIADRLKERDMEELSPRRKSRLSGEIGNALKKDRAKADILFALDHIVEAQRRKVTLEFYQALGDMDRHLYAVPNGDQKPESMPKIVVNSTGDIEWGGIIRSPSEIEEARQKGWLDHLESN